MNESNPDRDQLLADELARIHERMLDETFEDSVDTQLRGELHSEQKVLDFIERVKRAGSCEASDVAGPSTMRAGLSATQRHAETNLKSSVSQELCLPDKIGRFKTVKLLGQGGYGVVYHAIDPDLDRQVAIKIPRAEAMLTPELRGRFIREGKIAAAMSHPNIVTIYETGQLGAVCFIASELVQGMTLADWIAAQTEPVDQQGAAELISVLASALQHAHSRGVLHRDLKPANILIEGADANAVAAAELATSAKISDFGLARYEADPTNQTQSGSLIGTPAYMAPEQMNESNTTVGPTADIYSLGCILYELLAGRRPFAAGGVLEMLQAVQKTDPKPIHAFRKDVSRDLQAICLKCLEKDPDCRYRSGHDLSEDLRRWLNGQPVLARNVGRIGRLTKWSRRNPALATAVVMIFVSILSGMMISMWQWNRAERNLALAVERRALAERHMERVELVIDEMLTDVARVLQYVPRMESLRERLLKQAMRLQTELVEEDSDNPRIRFRNIQALRRLAKIQSWLGEYEQSIASGDRAYKMVGQLTSNDIPMQELARERLQICLDLNLPYYKLNRFESAESVAREAIDILLNPELEFPVEEKAVLMARAQRSLGMSLQRLNRNDDAFAAFQEAAKVVDGLPVEIKSDPEGLSVHYRVLNSLGVMSKSMNRFDDAKQYYDRSIDLNTFATDAFPERIDFRFDLAVTTLNFANYLFRQKEYERAMESYRVSSETTEKLVSEFPKVSRFRSIFVYGQIGLGAAYRRLAKSEDAIDVYLRAIEEMRFIDAQFGATPDQWKHLARAYNNLGLAYRDIERFDDAVASHRKGIEVLEQLVSVNPEEITSRLSLSIGNGNLGLLLLDLGNADAAKETLLEGLRIGQASYKINVDHSGVVDNLRWTTKSCVKSPASLATMPKQFSLPNPWQSFPRRLLMTWLLRKRSQNALTSFRVEARRPPKHR